MEIIKNKISNYNIISWLGYTLAGAFLFFGVAHHTINFWELPALWMLLLFVLLAPMLMALFAVMATRLLPYLIKIPKGRLLLLSLMIVAISSFIAWRFHRVPEVFQVLAIAPLQGDVRLLEFKRDSANVLLSEAAFESGWQEEDGAYLAVSDSQPLKFVFKSPANRPMSVLFLTSPDGGKVELTLNCQAARQVELASDLSGQTRLDFSTNYRGVPGGLFVAFLVFVDVLTFGLLVFGLFLFFHSNANIKTWYALGVGVLFVFCMALTIQINQKLTEKPNAKDSQQRLNVAYNLAYYGHFSADHGNFRPTNRREPLPIWFAAGWIALHPELREGLHHPASQESPNINEGNAVRLVKQSNLFWAFLVLVGVGISVLIALPNQKPLAFPGALLAVYLTFLFFASNGGVIDRMQHEIHAGALIVWLSLFLLLALSQNRYLWFACAGVAMGLLALTNASFLYINIVAMGMLFALYFWRPSQYGLNWKAIPRFMILVAIFVITIVPWMTRNYLAFDSFSISQRGAHVLNARSIKNQMDIPGGLYHYAPGDLRTVFGELLGYNDEDLELGGRLAGLNRSGNASFVDGDNLAVSLGRPEDAISYRQQAWAEMVFWQNHYRAQGEANAAVLAEQEIKRAAIERIVSDPGRHLAVSFVFLWRGMWSMGSTKFDLLLNGLSFLALLVLFFVGVWKGNPVFLGISTVSFIAFGFYAGATHFISRYSLPMIPSMIISFVLIGVLCMDGLRKALVIKVDASTQGE